MKAEVATAAPYRPKSTANLNLRGKHAGKMPRVGSKVRVELHGKVSSVSMHDHGEGHPSSNIDLEVHHVSHNKAQRGSLSDLIAARQHKTA